MKTKIKFYIETLKVHTSACTAESTETDSPSFNCIDHMST